MLPVQPHSAIHAPEAKLEPGGSLSPRPREIAIKHVVPASEKLEPVTQIATVPVSDKVDRHPAVRMTNVTPRRAAPCPP
jgi:hypothetical protein